MMLHTTWQDRMELAALEGALTHTPTIAPFIAEALDDARQDFDETEEALSDAVVALEKSLDKGD